MSMPTRAHAGRYVDLVRLLVRHGRSDLVSGAGLDEFMVDEDLPSGDLDKARELADDLERMGPTYIKLGQLLSTRFDLLPAAYTDALTRLQDSVEPFPFEQVREIVERELGPACATCSSPSTRSRWRPPRWGRCTEPAPEAAARSWSRCSDPAYVRWSGTTWRCCRDWPSWRTRTLGRATGSASRGCWRSSAARWPGSWTTPERRGTSSGSVSSPRTTSTCWCPHRCSNSPPPRF